MFSRLLTFATIITRESILLTIPVAFIMFTPPGYHNVYHIVYLMGSMRKKKKKYTCKFLVNMRIIETTKGLPRFAVAVSP